MAIALQATAAAPRQEPAVQERVLDLFAASCAECHGPAGEARAVRHWPDALDLAATAGDPELVVPGRPEDSNLYLTIEAGDMPPSDSDAPPVGPEGLALVAEWIRGGAAVAPPAPPPDSEARSGDPVDEPAPPAAGARAKPYDGQPYVRFASRLHPLAVHFPIALLVAAAVAELLAALLRRPALRSSATFCLALGTVTAVPAAGLGWLLAAETSPAGDALELHRWLGVATAALAVVACLWCALRPRHRLVALVLLATLVGFAGHTGGRLTFGADWLAWPE